MSETAATPAATRVAENVARRIMSQRRWRVWINVGIFVVVTVAMIVLSMAHRDAQAVQSCYEQLNFTCQELGSLLATGEVAPRTLPLKFPPEPIEDASPTEREEWEEETLVTRQHYFYNARYAPFGPDEGVVGVCCCKAPHNLFLRADGRHVLLFDGESYELKWMTETEFRTQVAGWDLTPAQATSLGLGATKSP